jgi:hypothetical protein
MKAIDIAHAEIGLVTSRVDGAITFKVITPELTLDQRAIVLGMHGKNARVMVAPIDVPTTGIEKVETEMDIKTPCQRLHAVIFVHWKSVQDQSEDFDTFYRKQMEKIIEGYKTKNLPPIDG